MAPATKFTLPRLELILRTLRGGATRTAAAAVAGIDRHTINEWVKDEKTLPGDITFAALLEGDPDEVYEKGLPIDAALTRAEGEAEAYLVSRIKKAGTESAKVTFVYDRQGNLLREVHEYDWRAAAWLLDHNPKHRTNWLPKHGIEVSGPDGGPVNIDGAQTVVFQPDAAYLASLGKMAAAHEPKPEPQAEDPEAQP